MNLVTQNNDDLKEGAVLQYKLQGLQGTLDLSIGSMRTGG